MPLFYRKALTVVSATEYTPQCLCSGGIGTVDSAGDVEPGGPSALTVDNITIDAKEAGPNKRN